MSPNGGQFRLVLVDNRGSAAATFPGLGHLSFREDPQRFTSAVTTSLAEQPVKQERRGCVPSVQGSRDRGL